MEQRKKKRYTRPGTWYYRLVAIQQAPNKWHHVYTSKWAASIASHLRSGYHPIPPGRWEFQSKKDKVYARYLGGGNHE